MDAKVILNNPFVESSKIRVVAFGGAKGETGKSAYEYAVENGYTGTEAEYGELMASYATVAEEAEESAERAEAAAETFETDDTLTQQGQAADAKKTGDEISDLKRDRICTGVTSSGRMILRIQAVGVDHSGLQSNDSSLDFTAVSQDFFVFFLMLIESR